MIDKPPTTGPANEGYAMLMLLCGLIGLVLCFVGLMDLTYKYWLPILDVIFKHPIRLGPIMLGLAYIFYRLAGPWDTPKTGN